MASSGSTGYYVHFACTTDGFAALVRDVLGPFESHAQWRREMAAVAGRSYILDPERLEIGWPIVLQPFGVQAGLGVPLTYEDVSGLHETWRSASFAEREILRQNWDLLDWMLPESLAQRPWLVASRTAGATADGCDLGLPFEQATLAGPSRRSEPEFRNDADRLRHEFFRLRQETRARLARDLPGARGIAVMRLAPVTSGACPYAQRLRKLVSIARSSARAGLRFAMEGATGVRPPAVGRSLSSIGLGFPVAASLPWLFRATAPVLRVAGREAQVGTSGRGKASPAAEWASSALTPLPLPSLISPRV